MRMISSLLRSSVAVLVLLCVFSCGICGVDAASEPKPASIENANEYRALGDMAKSKKQYKKALSLYAKLIEVQPNPQNYYRRAAVYLAQGKYTKVIPDLNKAIDIDPAFTKGLLHRGIVQSMLGQCAKARADFENVLKLKPGDKKALDKLPKAVRCIEAKVQAEAAFDAQQYDRAAPLLKAVLATATRSDELRLMLAECHLHLGRYQESLMVTREVLRENKANLQGLLLGGEAYWKLGEEETALGYAKKGLQSDPEHRALKKLFKKVKKLKKMRAAADRLLARGKGKEAADMYGEAMAIDGDNQPILVSLYSKQCEAYRKADDGQAAVKACTAAFNLDSNSMNLLLDLVEARLVAEQWQEAVNDAQKATEMDKNSQRARQVLQKAQLELKKSKAKNYYKILGVSRKASKQDIKKAFRKLALQYHPDKVKGTEEDKKVAEDKFKEIGEAYEVLWDDELRAKHDRGEDVYPNQGNNGGGGGGNPFGGGFRGFQQGGRKFNFKFN